LPDICTPEFPLLIFPSSCRSNILPPLYPCICFQGGRFKGFPCRPTFESNESAGGCTFHCSTEKAGAILKTTQCPNELYWSVLSTSYCKRKTTDSKCTRKLRGSQP